MARTPGRKRVLPAAPSPDDTQEVSNVAKSLTDYLYAPDETRVTCGFCKVEVLDIAEHLLEGHNGNITIEEYRDTFPERPLKGKPPPPQKKIRVTAKDVANHPGGREAAVIEKQLEQAEREAYREDVAGLIAKEYDPGYLVATVAYHMVLARRARERVENVRRDAHGYVFDSSNLRTLQEIEKVIQDGLKELEKLRLAKVGPKDDPVEIVERELAEAEAFIARHQGEHVERCNNCGSPLTPPGIPHWAFAPITTSRGTEYPVWSTELWRMVKNGMPLWIMAYTLRTSPEGLKYTAHRRGEPWPEDIDLGEQERVLRSVLETQFIEGVPIPAIRTMFAAAPPVGLPEALDRAPGGLPEALDRAPEATGEPIGEPTAADVGAIPVEEL